MGNSPSGQLKESFSFTSRAALTLSQHGVRNQHAHLICTNQEKTATAQLFDVKPRPIAVSLGLHDLPGCSDDASGVTQTGETSSQINQLSASLFQRDIWVTIAAVWKCQKSSRLNRKMLANPEGLASAQRILASLSAFDAGLISKGDVAQGVFCVEAVGMVSDPILPELPSITRKRSEAALLSFSTNSSNGMPSRKRL